MRTYFETSRKIPIADDADVIVCGGGPAGFAAAIAAARSGANTTLIEVHGCLGGVWTAGALSRILEANKPGVMAELTEVLDQRGARADHAGNSYSYDVEAMKLAMDEMAIDAGVKVQLHTRVVAAERDAGNRLEVVITESKSGRQAWTGNAIVDATGDGDVAAYAGCRYDVGHPESGQIQPMSLMALLTGVHLNDVSGFVAGGATPARWTADATREPNRYRSATRRLLDELTRAGISPSYAAPTLWAIYDDLFALMANHEYGVSALDAAHVTYATMRARSEIGHIVAGLRSLGGVWAGLRLVATGSQIGVREGRRIHGRYEVTVEDLRRGTRHPDAVCRVSSGADVHALSPDEGRYLSRTTDVLQNRSVAEQKIAPVQPYDIPLRALIARDVDGLLMAGRCISGDFLAHSSYRITGNAVAMGQAAGVTAALSATSGKLPHELPWSEVKTGIDAIDTSQRNTIGTTVGSGMSLEVP